MGTRTSDEVSEILECLELKFSARGFEFHPFKVGWYNDCVKPIFHLNYDDDALAVLVISKPSMFENTFLPYIKESYCGQMYWDPVDECMISCFSTVKKIFPNTKTEVVHDFELHPNRRPKLLMQTAAHVSGAAYFYQKKDVPDELFNDQKVYGVCIHPKYGGWFAVRAVILFPNILCAELKRKYPEDVVASVEKRLELLEMYNYHWRDWRFRDIISVAEKYSTTAIKYFSTLPKDRFKLIEDFMHCSGS